jgi:dolichol-phosphate mannosyltransferase
VGHDADRRVKLSVVIPAHDEAESIAETIDGLASVLDREHCDYEILVIDDASTDGTEGVVAEIAAGNGRVRCVRSQFPPGFGFAVRAGLELFRGDAVMIVMADGSDDPEDVMQYLRLLEAGHDCVFGSRFMRGSSVTDYPRAKLLLNRLANGVVRALFRHGLNDTTNAFKAYRREVIESVQPLVSNHFNLTVELPLKAIVRGHSYVICPISWRGRRFGASKLSLQEMGSRYVFIVLNVLLEHRLSRGDYHRGGFDRWQAHRLRPARPTAETPRLLAGGARR